ncbi:DNA-processing protein DprA [Patescibacteria group bacterium]
MCGVVNIDSPKYPKFLRTITNPPKQLFFKGNWSTNIFNKCLAVVGSRRMTTYGRMVTEKLVSEIALHGITVVSGFMYGIDATAHKAALSAGGTTIAVMPCGIELINPSNQEKLYREILDSSGLVLSEYSGSFQPQLWTYPKRNRIVAGLSHATLVVEAGERSGSLITANYANKFDRKVFAVPGLITSSNSIGTLDLLSKGATLVKTAADILSSFGFVSDLPLLNNPKTNFITKILLREPMNFDDLYEEVDVTPEVLNSEITSLLLSGEIIEEGGKYYVNKG